MSVSSLDQLVASMQEVESAYQTSLPPVQRWNPPLNGDLDMRIDREGNWFYQGGKIHRPALVKLFASILKREGDDFYLVTPVEKWRIQVDVAPFLVIDFTALGEGSDVALRLQTNVGNEFLLGPQHPLWIEKAADGSPLPLVMVRDDLPGLISRNVYYRLAELATETDGGYELQSAGARFALQ